MKMEEREIVTELREDTVQESHNERRDSSAARGRGNKREASPLRLAGDGEHGVHAIDVPPLRLGAGLLPQQSFEVVDVRALVFVPQRVQQDEPELLVETDIEVIAHPGREEGRGWERERCALTRRSA